MKLPTIVMTVLTLAATFPTGCTRNELKEQEANAASSARVRSLNDSNFDGEAGNGVVLVDFWATWCGPCKMQAPIIDDVARRVAGKAKVAKVDVDAAPKTAQRFGVRAIPTMVLLKDGRPEKQFVGLTKAETLISAITSTVESK